MKAFLAIFFTVIMFTGCRGGDEQNIVEVNNTVATTMQKDVEDHGISGDIDARCRPTGNAYTCDIYTTFSDGKRQHLGDANNVRLTETGVVWDREQ